MSARLPIPGNDEGTWGSILNEYLSVEHNADGTLKRAAAITQAQADAAQALTAAQQAIAGGVTDGSLTRQKLSAGVQASLTAADTAVQTVNGIAATNGAVTLTAATVGALTQAVADGRYPALDGTSGLVAGSQLPAVAVPPLTVDGIYVREGLHGPRYRTTGYNSYVMKNSGGTAAQTMNAAQREAFFAQLRAKSLVRVWFFAPKSGTWTWSQVLAELDAIVTSAKKYGHRIIGCFTDWWGNANDAFGLKNAAWFTGHAWRTSVSGGQSYEAWVRTVVARYAGEPTVAAYDLINEPQDQAGAITGDLTLFASEMTSIIKTIAPSVLCYMGVQYASAVGGNAAYQAIFASLDFCSSHYYDAAGYYTSKGSAVVCARALGKPLLIDEYGVWAKAFYGAYTDTDKDTNGLPAVSYGAQAQLVETTLKTAFDIPEVFGALVWSAMDTNASWFTGQGMYEPLSGSATERIIRTMPLPAGEGQIQDNVTNMESWIDACFTPRYAPGTQIGGPNSGATAAYIIYDRVNNNYRQSTQASAPMAGSFRDSTGVLWPTLQFNGTHRFPNFSMTTGSGQTHSLYAVVVLTALPSSGNYGYLVCPINTTNGFAVRINASGQVELYRYGSGGGIVGTGTTTLQLNRLYLIEVRWDAYGGGWRIRVNGNNDASGTNTATFGSDNASVGAESNGANGFTGHIVEMIKTKNSATGAEQARYYSYFTSKYAALLG